MTVRTLDLPDEKAAWIRDALAPDEAVLWSGEPTPRLFTKENAREAWMGLGMVVVSAYFVWRVLDGLFGTGDFEPVMLIGVGTLLLGTAMVLAPVRFRAALARTAYAVTDRRLLIVTRTQVSVFAPTDLGDPYSEDRPDRTADVYFARTLERFGRNTVQTRRSALYGVRHAKAAEDALRALRAAEDASLAQV